AHRYFEVEMNQLGTVWDLFLAKPYREGGHADNSWNIDGLRIAVALDGTLNDPRDRDRGWTVELAIPWAAFGDSGRNVVPPRAGARWRVNFSRVEWDVDTTGGRYVKRRDPAGKPLREHNWVWSPQGVIDMHQPEMWGVVEFVGGGSTVLQGSTHQ
ncbi:MAG: carbohydrate-binding family 9-like protein, partial [Gemmatimonadales bacterium]